MKELTHCQWRCVFIYYAYIFGVMRGSLSMICISKERFEASFTLLHFDPRSSTLAIYFANEYLSRKRNGSLSHEFRTYTSPRALGLGVIISGRDLR